jgi:hypothetical protein
MKDFKLEIIPGETNIDDAALRASADEIGYHLARAIHAGLDAGDLETDSDGYVQDARVDTGGNGRKMHTHGLFQRERIE